MHVVCSYLPIQPIFSVPSLIGENPNRVYSQSRMDGAWNFRNAYNEARKVKEAQDQFCKHAEAGEWDMLESDLTGHKGKKKHKNLPAFPEDLQWESLVDVLRGKVKVRILFYCLKVD